MSEQAKVGLMVLISAAVLLTAVFYMANIGLGTKYNDYKMYLVFAGGLEPGSPVRFGGLKVGRVKDLNVAPKDARIEIHLSVKDGTPVRKDSVAALSQLGFLGENYVEIQPGKAQDILPPGSVIPSAETQDIAALMRRMNQLAEQASPLLADLHKNLNMVTSEVDLLLKNLQSVTGAANRDQLAGILRNTNEMIARTSPKIDATMANFERASTRLDPLMDDLRTATAKMQAALDQVNGLVTDNRKEVQAAILTLNKTLESTRTMMTQLNTTLADNSQNLDAIFENLRVTSTNLSELSETLKQRPFSLIRVVPKPDRPVPGAAASKNQRGGQ